MPKKKKKRDRTTTLHWSECADFAQLAGGATWVPRANNVYVPPDKRIHSMNATSPCAKCGTRGRFGCGKAHSYDFSHCHICNANPCSQAPTYTNPALRGGGDVPWGVPTQTWKNIPRFPGSNPLQTNHAGGVVSGLVVPVDTRDKFGMGLTFTQAGLTLLAHRTGFDGDYINQILANPTNCHYVPFVPSSKTRAPGPNGHQYTPLRFAEAKGNQPVTMECPLATKHLEKRLILGTAHNAHDNRPATKYAAPTVNSTRIEPYNSRGGASLNGVQASCESSSMRLICRRVTNVKELRAKEIEKKKSCEFLKIQNELMNNLDEFYQKYPKGTIVNVTRMIDTQRCSDGDPSDALRQTMQSWHDYNPGMGSKLGIVVPDAKNTSVGAGIAGISAQKIDPRKFAKPPRPPPPPPPPPPPSPRRKKRKQRVASSAQTKPIPTPAVAVPGIFTSKEQYRGAIKTIPTGDPDYKPSTHIIRPRAAGHYHYWLFCTEWQLLQPMKDARSHWFCFNLLVDSVMNGGGYGNRVSGDGSYMSCDFFFSFHSKPDQKITLDIEGARKAYHYNNTGNHQCDGSISSDKRWHSDESLSRMNVEPATQWSNDCRRTRRADGTMTTAMTAATDSSSFSSSSSSTSSSTSSSASSSSSSSTSSSASGSRYVTGLAHSCDRNSCTQCSWGHLYTTVFSQESMNEAL
jgi:hypothetical protein